MKITVNGEIIDLSANATITDIIEKQNIKTTMFAVERNLQIIPKDKYNETVLTEGDKIEIVNFVGGG